MPEAQRTQGIACKLELSLQLMVAPLALVPNLATRWRHLHELKNWPPDGATGISSKFGHQMASLALVPKLATRLPHMHCHITFNCPLALSVGIDLVSSTARVTSVKSTQGVGVREDINSKRTFSFGHFSNYRGGLPMPGFFGPFLLPSNSP